MKVLTLLPRSLAVARGAPVETTTSWRTTRHGDCQGRSRRAASAHGGGELTDREPWVTKRQLAAHLGVTCRWIEYQQHLGLPHLRLGAINRYSVSEVEAWLRERYSSTPRLGGPDAA